MNNAVGKCGLIGYCIFCILSIPAMVKLQYFHFTDLMFALLFAIPGLLIGALIGLLFRKNPGNSSNSGMDNVEKIAELKKLLDSGALTQEEFEEQKKKILNS